MRGRFAALVPAAFAVALGLRAGPAQAIEDVPFIVTPGNVTAAMLDIAAVKAGDHVIDLGSGDGRIVIGAARRGATALGVEIDKRLVDLSVENAKREGVASLAQFREQDLFATDLSPASVITMYLLPAVNLQLRPRLLELAPGTRVVSHDWDMGEWQPDKSITVPAPEKNIGIEKSSRVHLWVIPARLEGLWCGINGKRGIELALRQSFQHATGEVLVDGRMLSRASATVSGPAARFNGPETAQAGQFAVAASGSTLRVTGASGVFSAMAGAVLARRKPASSCDN